MAIDKGFVKARRATAAEWTAENPVLAAGEIGFEHSTGKLKVGDGTTAWSSLAYFASANGLLTVDQTVTDGVDLALGTTAGTKIGTGATQKLGFYGATPVAKQTGVANTAGGIYTALQNLGLIAP